MWSHFSATEWLVRTCCLGNVQWQYFLLGRKSQQQIFMHDFNAYTEMPACAPTVADDRYGTSKTGTQTSLNSTILVAHKPYQNRGKIELIEGNRCVTMREMATKTRIEHHVVQKLVESLGCQKVCAYWVPCYVMEQQKLQWKKKKDSSQLLRQYNVKGEDFHHSIVRGDKRWFHHFDPATKWQTTGWQHTTLPKKIQLKTILSACKTMFPVLWEAKGCILVKRLPQREAIAAAHYLQSLQKLQCSLLFLVGNQLDAKFFYNTLICFNP